MKTVLAMVLLLLVVTGSGRALAVDCPVPEGSSPAAVASQGSEARLRFLSGLLQEESQAARRWTLGWGGAYGALTVAQLGVMGLFPHEEQPDWYWGALSSVVGVAFTVMDPLEVLEGGAVYAQRLRHMAPQDACMLINEGERMLREGAAHEAQSRSWFIHVGNVLFNVGLGLVLGLGYGRWTSGLINAAVGAAIGEATILTAPSQLISGWARYRSGAPAGGVAVHVVPTAGPGLGVRVEF